jgi:DNA-binding response OmpR family regulator
MTDTKKVLIVEDEAAVALALSDALSAEGLSVSVAKDGQAGLDMALAEHPDLILTDLRMPGMDGMAMIDKLHEDSWGRDANIIILSNASDLDTLKSAMEHNAFHYMVKGDNSMADIVAAVKKQLHL